MEGFPRNSEFRFCPICGAPLDKVVLKKDRKPVPVCPGCGYIIYMDPKVVACTLVDVEGGIVLLKRAKEPGKGKWATPGGYVDRGEPVEAAAVRETWEEAGVMVRLEGLAGVYSYRDETPIMIFYYASPVSGILEAGDECLEAKVFPPDKIPWDDLAFKSTARALEVYLKKRKGKRRVPG